MRSEVCCSSSLVDFLAKERKSFDFLWLACFLLDHFAQHTLTLAITHRVKASSKSELSNSVAISSFTVRGSRDFDKETAVCLFAFETWWCPPSILGLTVHQRLNGPFTKHSKASFRAVLLVMSDSTSICTADVGSLFWKSLESERNKLLPPVHVQCWVPFLSFLFRLFFFCWCPSKLTVGCQNLSIQYSALFLSLVLCWIQMFILVYDGHLRISH